MDSDTMGAETAREGDLSLSHDAMHITSDEDLTHLRTHELSGMERELTSAEKYVMHLKGVPQYEDELFSTGEWLDSDTRASRAPTCAKLQSHHC